MEWSEVDEILSGFPFCNVTQAYEYMIETTIDIGTKSVGYLSNMTGCKPNCVSYKYEVVKTAPSAKLGDFYEAANMPSEGLNYCLFTVYFEHLLFSAVYELAGQNSDP